MDFFNLGSRVQEKEDIFGETKAEKALVIVLIKVVPEIIEEEA
jgi:hypothetical protein